MHRVGVEVKLDFFGVGGVLYTRYKEMYYLSSILSYPMSLTFEIEKLLAYTVISISISL
jgi:hypothetical protein